MKNLAKNWKTLFTVSLIFGLVGMANAEKLGANYKPTKYEIGDKFYGDFGIWELVEFVPVYKALPEIPELSDIWIHRWRIKIHSKHVIAEAWTDDHWLDQKRKSN
jgi:hypothetical protein